MTNQEFAEYLDLLEQLVEKSPLFMGKRFVNEEEFYTHIQMIRAKLRLSAAPTQQQPEEKSPWS